MISHCCASCGRPLDGSSRVFLRELRMWVARCTRCGHAVRWNPRGAREPFRIWARLRALNLRLGIAFSAGQAAGIGSLAIGAFLLDEYRWVVGGASPSELVHHRDFLMYLAFAGVTALLAAVSAVAFAPTRPLLTRIALAWTAGALPVVAIVGMVPLSAADEARFKLVRAFSEPGFTARTVLLCGAVPILSAILAAPIGAIWSAIHGLVLHRHRLQTRNTRAST